MNKSESIIELAKAMAKFQAEVKNPANTANNPFFKSKYAPLNEILNDVRPLLTKNGLSVLQMPSGNGDEVVITTLLMHESGEWIESCPLKMKPAKNDPQGVGSAITYGRRYAVSAILGISSEDDDDGNGATHGKSSPTDPTPKTTPAKSSTKTTTPATDTQIKKLFATAKEKGVDQEALKLKVADLGKSSTKELTAEECSKLIDWVNKWQEVIE